MHDVHVSIFVNADVPRVFAFVSDHERFLQGPDLSCELTVEGATDPTGVGAVRVVTAGSLLFTEEITGFEPPSRYDYRIASLRLPRRAAPLRHHGGRVEFIAQDGGTRIDWRSRFEITIPLIGRLIEPLAGRSTRRAFDRVLVRAKAELERGDEAP